MQIKYLHVTLVTSAISGVLAAPLVPTDFHDIHSKIRAESAAVNRYAVQDSGSGMPTSVNKAAFNEQNKKSDLDADMHQSTDSGRYRNYQHDAHRYFPQAASSGRHQSYPWTGVLPPRTHRVQRVWPEEERHSVPVDVNRQNQRNANDQPYAPFPPRAPAGIRLGRSSCTDHGEFLCNGRYSYGLCNWGIVIWQPVAAGTMCTPDGLDFDEEGFWGTGNDDEQGDVPGYAPRMPAGTQYGSDSCSDHGEFMCNGRYLYGICNWGTVIWQPVAAGTMCTPEGLDYDEQGYWGHENGRQVDAPSYDAPAYEPSVQQDPRRQHVQSTPCGNDGGLSCHGGEPVRAPGYAPTVQRLPTEQQRGSATCANHGEFLCNGRYLYGLCNWGHVVWQRVAAGTMCTPHGLDYDN